MSRSSTKKNLYLSKAFQKLRWKAKRPKPQVFWNFSHLQTTLGQSLKTPFSFQKHIPKDSQKAALGSPGRSVLSMLRSQMESGTAWVEPSPFDRGWTSLRSEQGTVWASWYGERPQIRYKLAGSKNFVFFFKINRGIKDHKSTLALFHLNKAFRKPPCWWILQEFSDPGHVDLENRWPNASALSGTARRARCISSLPNNSNNHRRKDRHNKKSKAEVASKSFKDMNSSMNHQFIPSNPPTPFGIRGRDRMLVPSGVRHGYW